MANKIYNANRIGSPSFSGLGGHDEHGEYTDEMWDWAADALGGNPTSAFCPGSLVDIYKPRKSTNRDR
jgi:hypothetical protein